MAREQSSIGSSIYYNARSVDADLGASRGNAGAVEVLTYKFPWNDLPATGSSDAGIPFIPSGSVILSCYVNKTTAITGATDYTVGTIDVDGGNADVDSLMTAAVAGIGAGVDIGTGALIGAETQDDTQLTFAFTGTETGGELEIRVEYYKA